MRKQADALKVCPIPDACLLVMAQRPSRLLGLPETRSLIFLIKNSPDQVEGYLDYPQPAMAIHPEDIDRFLLLSPPHRSLYKLLLTDLLSTSKLHIAVQPNAADYQYTPGNGVCAMAALGILTHSWRPPKKINTPA